MSAAVELRECAGRTRAGGTAVLRATSELNVPGGEELPTGPLDGQVDFADDRWRLGMETVDALVADGRLLYERQPDDRWTRRRLREGRYIMWDPRMMLELLATGCQWVQATGSGSYQVRYEPARVTECVRPKPAPVWTSFTGTVTVDDAGRVTVVSMRMATESGDEHVETALSFSDFDAPVRIEPPDQAVDYDDYVTEMFGDPLPEGLIREED